MEQLVREAGRGFEGVAERVSEIEQRTLAGLALVARYDASFAAARDRDRVLARSATGEHVLPICFQPGEEARITEQPELGELRITGPKFARGERVEQCRV